MTQRTQPTIKPKQLWPIYMQAITCGAIACMLCQLLSILSVCNWDTPWLGFWHAAFFGILVFTCTLIFGFGHMLLIPVLVVFVYHTMKQLRPRTFSPKTLALMFLFSSFSLLFLSVARLLGIFGLTLNGSYFPIPTESAILCVVVSMLPFLFHDAAAHALKTDYEKFH